MKQNMSSFLLSTASQQEIAALEAKVIYRVVLH